jgi:putative ABC transport system permease protein
VIGGETSKQSRNAAAALQECRSPAIAGSPQSSQHLTASAAHGANTAVFSIVNGVVLRPAPFKTLERLVLVWETDRNTSTTREPASVPDYLDLRARDQSVQPLAALMAAEMNLTPPGSDPVRLAVLRVSGEFLPMLGIEPIAGRMFRPSDDVVGGPDVALISKRNA